MHILPTRTCEGSLDCSLHVRVVIINSDKRFPDGLLQFPLSTVSWSYGPEPSPTLGTCMPIYLVLDILVTVLESRSGFHCALISLMINYIMHLSYTYCHLYFLFF